MYDFPLTREVVFLGRIVGGCLKKNGEFGGLPKNDWQ